MKKESQKEKITLEKDYVRELERKASFFEGILSFIEDEYLGHLMEETEREDNISLLKAKKELK